MQDPDSCHLTGAATAPESAARRELLADGVLSPNAAAKFIDVCRSIIYRYMKNGTLPYLELDEGRRIPKRALIQFLDSRLKKQETEE